MIYDGGKVYYDDGKQVPESNGSVFNGLFSGSSNGFVIIIAVFLVAVVAGELALLWFIITGYKKFNLGDLSRIIAFGLSIIYSYFLYTTFMSRETDLMTLAYANIPIVIFFAITYIFSKQNK